MIPVTDDQAKALQKLADFGTTAVEETGGLARYVGRILGTAPEDVVGIVLGDPLRFIRTIIAQKLDDKISTILRSRNVKIVEPVSPSLAIPLLRAAYDESREEIQEIWAKLLAAAMDPQRADRVRGEFVDAVKRLHPRDAIILDALYGTPGQLSPNPRDYFASHLAVSSDAIEVSFKNLEEIGCLSTAADRHTTPFGRELMRACRD